MAELSVWGAFLIQAAGRMTRAAYVGESLEGLCPSNSIRIARLTCGRQMAP